MQHRHEHADYIIADRRHRLLGAQAIVAAGFWGEFHTLHSTPDARFGRVAPCSSAGVISVGRGMRLCDCSKARPGHDHQPQA